MVERISEKKRGTEPQETLYDVSVKIHADLMRGKAEGKVIIRGKDVSFEQNRQGLVKYLVHTKDWSKLGVPGWHFFINRVKVHSGKHVHQGGLALFVLGGKGHTVVDGVRYDWEEGDLIVLPVKPGGVEHQHFNEGDSEFTEWLAFDYHYMLDMVNMGVTQKEEHPDWAKPR